MADQKTFQFDREDMEILSSVRLLHGLSEGLIGRLAGKRGARQLERGTILFHQDQPTGDVHVVLSGWIKLYRTGEAGGETIVRLAGPGEVVGDADLLWGQGYQTCAEVVCDARVLSLDGKRLATQMRRDPALALRLAASLSGQIQHLTRHIEEMKVLDAQQRTAQFLLSYCPVQPGSCFLALPYEKALIAGWLGMKPASFSRALARLRKFGVTSGRDTVSISDTRRLAALVRGVAER